MVYVAVDNIALTLVLKLTSTGHYGIISRSSFEGWREF